MINVVITTKSVTKCIFLNFGAIPKRMVKVAKLYSQKLKLQCRVHIKFTYKNKIKLFTEKKLKIPPSPSSSSCPTPHSSPTPYYPLPLAALHIVSYFLQNIKAYILQRNILNSLRDNFFDTNWQKWCILNSFLRNCLFDRRLWNQCNLNHFLRDHLW